jgi:trimethylamine:corrinoid methyltransferase-like protein
MDSLLQRPALAFLALDLLNHAGCTVDQEGRVKIPSVIVDKALR